MNHVIFELVLKGECHELNIYYQLYRAKTRMNILNRKCGAKVYFFLISPKPEKRIQVGGERGITEILEWHSAPTDPHLPLLTIEVGYQGVNDLQSIHEPRAYGLAWQHIHIGELPLDRIRTADGLWRVVVVMHICTRT